MLGIRRTIHIRKTHEGLLHKDLDVPAGQPFPGTKLDQASRASNPVERKRAPFVEKASQFHHPKKVK